MVALFEAEGQAVYGQAPATGSVSYSGLLGAVIQEGTNEPVELIADMTAVADFGNGTVSGEATNFQNTQDVYIEGTLIMSSGAFIGSSDPWALIVFAAEFDGNVVIDGTQYVFDGQGGGGFTGDDLDYLAGEASGTLTQDGANVGTVNIDFALNR